MGFVSHKKQRAIRQEAGIRIGQQSYAGFIDSKNIAAGGRAEFMSRKQEMPFECPECGVRGSVTIYTSINVTLNPELKELIWNDTLNLARCPGCGVEGRLDTNVMYHDMKNEFVVWFQPGQHDLTETIEFFRKQTEGLDRGAYFANPLVEYDWEGFKRTVMLRDAAHGGIGAETKRPSEEYINQDLGPKEDKASPETSNKIMGASNGATEMAARQEDEPGGTVPDAPENATGPRGLTGFCPKCGKKNEIHAYECVYCGRSLVGDAAGRTTMGQAGTTSQRETPLDRAAGFLANRASSGIAGPIILFLGGCFLHLSLNLVELQPATIDPNVVAFAFGETIAHVVASVLFLALPFQLMYRGRRRSGYSYTALIYSRVLYVSFAFHLVFFYLFREWEP